MDTSSFICRHTQSEQQFIYRLTVKTVDCFAQLQLKICLIKMNVCLQIWLHHKRNTLSHAYARINARVCRTFRQNTVRIIYHDTMLRSATIHPHFGIYISATTLHIHNTRIQTN